MNLKILFVVAFVFACFHSRASFVKEETAIKAAESFFSIQSGNTDYSVSETYSEKYNGITTFYIFNFSPEGFVVVSSDNNISPILGYSFSGSLNINHTSPQLKAWLDMYSASIYDAINEKKTDLKNNLYWDHLLAGNFSKAKYIVTPLCSTLWKQDCFYNEFCPSDTLGPCDHAVTGCVATAMSQIMKYWNYPVKGQGLHSYISFWYGPLSANFGATTYDWSSMPDDVISTNPAVATLMNHCGISVDMDYYATSSGSNNYFAVASLKNYFKYSNNISFVYRLNYSDSAWIELMKSEMDAGRPVLYQGGLSGFPTGHSWVCDGYDSNDFLHFNWGDGNTSYWQIGNWIYNINNEAVIKIMPIVSCDIALREFVSPVPSTFLSPSTIKIKVSNYDTLPQANIPVSYVVDGGTPVTEIITLPLAALSDTVYEFIQPFDFSPNPGHVYNVKVYSGLLCDGYKFNDTLTIPVENVACVSPPYSMGFEPTENMNGWVIEDVQGDGNKWNIGAGGYSQPKCIYYNGGSSQANDWFISKCLQLETNKMYKLSYYYNGMGTFNPNKLSVYIGNQPQITDLTTLLFQDTNIVNNTYLKTEIFFTVPADGSYYLGWFCHSDANMYSLAIDDINITEQIANDIGIVSVNLPGESCDLQLENIEVVIKNYCSSVLNNFPVSYSVNGGTPVTENVIIPVPVGGTFNFIFSTPADLSADGQYQLKIYTSLTGDTLNVNDTLNRTVINHQSISPDYTMEFEPADDFSGWKVINNNNDVYTWTIQNTGGRTNPYCIRYDYSSWIPADDWFISSCINLSSTQSYRLSFWHKIESDQWPEKLKVFIGNNNDISSLNVQLLDFPNLTNMTYQYAEATFNVPADGLYYIGWYCYSDASMFNLYVDDISLDDVTNSDDHPANNVFTAFPNPFSQEVCISHSGNSGENIQYEISDPNGRILLQTTSKNNFVNFSTKNLSNGIYILKIKSAKEVYIRKLLKK